VKEFFYEESARIQNEKSASVKYYVFKTLSIIFYVFAGFYLFIFFNFVPIDDTFKNNILLNIIFMVVPLALFIVSGIIFGRFKNKFYIDYDYTFVSGSIRVAKVIKNYKRKLVFNFDTSAIEKMGKYGSETYNQYEKSPGIKKHFLTLNYTASEGKEFYYLVVNVDDNKNLLVLECTELFMATILKYSNKTILEKDFK
jgi:hypothetical protein